MDDDATIITSPPVRAVPSAAGMGDPPLGADNYRVGAEIARGGMGSVLRAEDQKLKRTVAVKVMHLDASADAGMRQRFLREAEVLSLLAHPNIVPIYDIVWEGGQPLFYSMKLVKGRTLQAVINDLRNQHPEALREFTLDRLLLIFRKVCDAIAFAHSQGVLHRDLKPENVMVGEFGEVLVMDWGLAKQLRVEELRVERKKEADSQLSSFNTHLTQTLDGAVMGTPQYMSPEQARGEIDELDERSDLFSLGGILYAILTLRPPVEGATLEEVLRKVTSAEITSPSELKTSVGKAATKGDVLDAKLIKPLPHTPGGRVPPALSSVVMKALRLDKARRYQNVAALSADIEAYQGGFATSAEQAGLTKLLMLLMLRHKAVSASLAAMVLLSIGFVLKVMASERRATQNAEIAQQNENEAKKKGEAARVALARSQTSLAEAAYREFDSQAMVAALNGVPEDLRDTDWRYLRARAVNSQASITFPKNNFLVGVAAHSTKPGVFAGALQGNTFVFVDALSGQRVFEFPGTERQRKGGFCRTLDFSRDGTRMVAGALMSGGVAIYDTATGKPVAEWEGTGKDVSWVCISPDATKVIALSAGVMAVHDAATGKTLWNSKAGGRAVFSPRGEVVVAPTFNNVCVYDSTTGALIKTLPRLPDYGAFTALSPDGAVIYLGCNDGVVRGQRLADGAITFERRLTESHQPVRVAISADGRCLLGVISLPSHRMARVWDTATGVTLQTLMGGTGGIEDVAMHPLTDEAIISGPDTRTWALATRAVEFKVPGHSNAAVFWGAEDVFIARDMPAKLGADGRWSDLPMPLPEECRGGIYAAVGGEIAAFGKTSIEGSPIAIIRRSAGGFTLLHTVRTKAALTRMRLSPDGRRLITVNAYATAEVFDTATGQPLFESGKKVIWAIHDLGWIGADRIVGIGISNARGSASSEERVFVWDAATGKVLRDVRNTAEADVLAVAPDGRTFAEGGKDKRVRIRDAETLEVLREFRAHDSPITALAFHPTQPVLATGSLDLDVRLWSLTDLSLIEEMRPSASETVKLAFSPRGTRLASTDGGVVTCFLNLVEPPLGKITRKISKVETGAPPAIAVDNGKTSGSEQPTARIMTKAPVPIPADAGDWSDLLAALVAAPDPQMLGGWRIPDGVLHSPDADRAVVQFPGSYAGKNFQLRLKVRRKRTDGMLCVAIPVADRMTCFGMDGFGNYTALFLVDGKSGADVPGAVKGRQLNDENLHTLELTVRTTGSESTISATLDGLPLYSWTGPHNSLEWSQDWPRPKAGTLAIGTRKPDWVVEEVKARIRD